MSGSLTPIHLIARALAERNILGPHPSATGLTNLASRDNFFAIEGPWLIAAVLQNWLMGIIVVQRQLRLLWTLHVGTAGITTVVAMVNALSFALNNTISSFWIIPNFAIARVYTISLLQVTLFLSASLTLTKAPHCYVLNSGRSLRLVAEGGNTSTGEERGGTKSKSRFGRSDAVGGINVNLETFIAHDTADDLDVGEKRQVRF